MLTVAILGRPNVGKSTLFNRLTGKKMAIVDDTPGITRDWRIADAALFGEAFKIVDTAGLEDKFDDSIPARMRAQTEAALKHTDVVLFMIDGREGLVPMDRHFAGWLRKQKKPVICVVNKCENAAAAAAGMAESHALGFGDPVFLSAAHGEGMDDLFDALSPHFPPETGTSEAEDRDDEGAVDDTIDAIEGDENYDLAEEEEEKSLKIAIVGRPNVGKSTLLNAILGEHRSITGPEAGLTRDAVAVDWDYAGSKFRLVDTAGLRRRARVQDTIEKQSAADSLRAIRLAHVVVLVLDANAALEKQDLQIADHIIREGRALVLAINKWDTVTDRKKTTDDIIYVLDTSLAQVKNIPRVTLSALNGRNVTQVMDAALDAYALWNKRIRTAGLNRWLAAMESRNAPPLVDGRANRLKYIAQIKTRPPTFALWVSRADGLPDTYRRYLINGLCETFDLKGVPVRLLIRKSKNPFTDQ